MIDLRDGRITDLINNQMAYNPETMSIGYAILQEKQRLMALVDRTRLMAVVENLEEWVLDYLAVELRAPAYEDRLPIEVKRELITGTLPFYAKLGTPQAINWATRTIFGGSQLQEWFEYDGEPYNFKLDIALGEDEWNKDKHRQMLWGVELCKNLRSHLESVNYHIPPAALENRNTLSLALFSTALRISSLGEEIILLDGRRSLDGGWLLLQKAKRVVALQSFTWKCNGANRQSLTGALLIPGAVRNRQNTAAKAVYSASGMNRQQTHQHHTTAVRAQPPPQALSATLTATVDNRLDGIFMLDGSRKLYAGTSSREL